MQTETLLGNSIFFSGREVVASSLPQLPAGDGIALTEIKGGYSTITWTTVLIGRGKAAVSSMTAADYVVYIRGS